MDPITLSMLGKGVASAAPGLLTGLAGLLDRGPRRRRIEKQYGGITKNMQALSGQFGQDRQDIQGELNTNFLDTEEGMSFLNAINQGSTDQRRQLAGMGALGGLTDEARIAGMGQINQGQGRAISGLNQGAQARKMGLRGQRSQVGNQQMNTLSNLFNAKRMMENDFMQGNSMFMQGVGQPLNQAAGDFLGSYKKA